MASACVALVACAENGVEPAATAAVSLSVAATGVSSTTVVDGNHQLRFDRVALVVGDIMLGDAELLESGPALLEAPLDGSVRSLVASVVEPGRYDELSLTFHAPVPGTPPDDVFLASHPGFDGVSVRVEGWWDDVAFVFERRLDEYRAVDLRGLDLLPGRTRNVTLLLDPASWFRADDGSLIDPAGADTDPVVAARVESRIRGSLEAFTDQDADGVADPS